MAVYSSNATRPSATCLPFNPGQEFKALQRKSGLIDRYLFGVHCKPSKAPADRTWIRSRAARFLKSNSDCDIFARHSYIDVADALRRRFDCEGFFHEEDNFVR
ncbi:hypothetical protein MBLNU13_g09406t1 [Cladosporium sp. NU13]